MKKTKTFKVEQFSFNKGKFRFVEVPVEELTKNRMENLELIYKYGQNDFQPQNSPSVSSGDVVHYSGERYIVANMGFSKLKNETYDRIRKCLKKSLNSVPSPSTTFSHFMFEEFGKEAFNYC